MNIDLKFVGPKSKVKLLDSLKESFYLERELQVHCYDEACVFPQEKGIMEGGSLILRDILSITLG